MTALNSPDGLPTPDGVGGSDPAVPDETVGPPLPPGTDMMSVDARRVMLAGTVAFGLAFLLLLPFWSWLGEHGHRVWLWTALSGTVLGLLALPLIRKHTDEGRLG